MRVDGWILTRVRLGLTASVESDRAWASPELQPGCKFGMWRTGGKIGKTTVESYRQNLSNICRKCKQRRS